MPEKYFLLGAGKESRMEEVLCSAQQHGFKEIVTLVKGNDNTVFEHENIPNLLRCIMKFVEVNDIVPRISFKILSQSRKEMIKDREINKANMKNLDSYCIWVIGTYGIIILTLLSCMFKNFPNILKHAF